MLASAYKFLMTPGRRARETSPSATARFLRFAPEDDQIHEYDGGVETPPGSPPSGYARTLSRDDAEGVTDRTTEPNGAWIFALNKISGSTQHAALLKQAEGKKFKLSKADYTSFAKEIKETFDQFGISTIFDIPTGGDGSVKSNGTRDFKDSLDILQHFGEAVQLQDVERLVACINGQGVLVDRDPNDEDPYTRRTPVLHGNGVEGAINQHDFFKQASGNALREVLYKYFGKELIQNLHADSSFVMKGRDEKTGQLYGEGLLLLCRVLQIMKPSHNKAVKDAKQVFENVKYETKHGDSSMTVCISSLLAAQAEANKVANSKVITNQDVSERIVEVVNASSATDRLKNKVAEITKKHEQAKLTYPAFLDSLRDDTEVIVEADAKPTYAQKTALSTNKDGENKSRNSNRDDRDNRGRGRGKHGRGRGGGGGRGRYGGRGRGQREKQPRFNSWEYAGDTKWHPALEVKFVWVEYTDHPDGTPGAYYHPNKVPSKFHPQLKKRGLKCDDSQRRAKSPKRKPESESNEGETKKFSTAPSKMVVKRAFVTSAVSNSMMTEDEAADEFERTIGKEWSSKE